jgi:hypothetical protein
MTKRNNIEKAVDDATEDVVAAADDLKAGATAIVEGLGRATQKKLRHVRAATETAWDEAGSTAKNLHSKGLLYVRIHPAGDSCADIWRDPLGKFCLLPSPDHAQVF